MGAMKRDYVLVLLVEDDEGRRRAFARWLSHPKIRIVVARTGDIALRLVETDAYDLILLDRDLDQQHPLGRLSRINGQVVVRRLVESPKNRFTRIIVHSMNPAGARAMRDQLSANGREVSLEPFADWTEERGLALREELLEELRYRSDSG